MHSSLLPGGGLAPSDEFRHVRICLCGHPMPVRTVARFDEVGRSLQQSLQAAQHYRERMGPDQIVAELTRGFITHAEFQALSDQVSALESILQQFRKKDQKKDAQKTLG